MSTPYAALRVGCALILLNTCALAAEPITDRAPADAGAEAAAPRSARPQFSGVYPHLAAVAESYSECGIGAVVPWADRLWYVSYVSHKSGGGVGLYEITPGLEIRKRPESVVGTHAGRMIHRESNQLVIGPYAIDADGNVRVIEGLTGERVTAVIRHLTDPARMIYVQAMEGGFYEVDVRTLEARRLFDLSREALGIQGKAHFKGGYTAQGRVVVANNTYHDGDQRRGTGGGRLAEWDGHRWNIIHRTAFCDVTSAGGIYGAPSDDAPLYAIGWDRASVLLAVRAGGKWSTYRLPKGSQSYDHAWCTEWPRIRETSPGHLMLDMHGLFYTMPPDFAPGAADGLAPLASHLRMTPDFCPWQGKFVLAGNELSSLNHRHRTGGQPQSNLWFGSLDRIARWGKPAGWGGPWFQDEVAAGVPSDPFLVAGFTNRTLHLFQDMAPPQISRCTGRFDVVELPEKLAGLGHVTIDRGSMQKPAPGYSFQVDRDAVVYLAVHDRGEPKLPDGWQKTPMKIVWRHGGPYTDTVYQRSFPKGTVEIPGHDGHNERGHCGVPHLCFVGEASPGAGAPTITGLPDGLGARWVKPKKPEPPTGATFTVEVDRRGSGEWAPYTTIELAPGGYAYHVLPDDFPGTWIRLTADRDSTVTAQFFFGSHFDSPSPDEPAGAASPSFRSLSPITEPCPRIHGALLPFANRLWFLSYVRDGNGRAVGGALYEIDEDVTFRKRAESLSGVFANRKMVAGLLSIGPHLVSDDGRVRTFLALAGRHVVSSIRHAQPGKIYFLTGDGRLLEGDLETLAVTEAANLPDALGLEAEAMQFKAGHLTGDTLLVAASSRDGRTGCLLEREGDRWTVVDRAAFAQISNLGSMSETVVATGWDRASALLKIRDRAGGWSTCRLPKASPAYDTAWTGEWPRIREVVTERMLMDVHGLMYEVSGLTYAWSIRPITAHGRMISDFCSWRGMLVLAGADVAANPDANYVRRGPDAGLWLGMTDDLWQLGKPAGVGGPWLDTPVRAGEPSDPYLMADFEHKRVELRHAADQAVKFTIEVDPIVAFRSAKRRLFAERTATMTVQPNHWQPYQTITVPPGKTITHEFPAGFSAHWVRVVANRDCAATAQFVYE